MSGRFGTWIDERTGWGSVKQTVFLRNIPKVDIIDTAEINPYTLIGFDNVLMTKAAVEKVEAWLA